MTSIYQMNIAFGKMYVLTSKRQDSYWVLA